MKTIHARPFDFSFEPAHTALVMIDMQRDFILPGGFGESLGNNVSLLTSIVPCVGETMDICRRNGIHVIHTKEAHQPDLSDCPPAKRNRGNPKLRIGDPGPMGRILIDGETGADFVPECAPQAGDTVVVKPGKGAFYATGLDEMLKAHGITSLLVGGVTTEVCVQTTLREANDRGYECLLLTDATASYFPQFKQSVIEMVVAQGGIVGWAADHTAFKAAF